MPIEKGELPPKIEGKEGELAIGKNEKKIFQKRDLPFSISTKMEIIQIIVSVEIEKINTNHKNQTPEDKIHKANDVDCYPEKMNPRQEANIRNERQAVQTANKVCLQLKKLSRRERRRLIRKIRAAIRNERENESP